MGKYPRVETPALMSKVRKINVEVDSDDVQELMDSHNQEQTIDKLIEIHEHDQAIEELECFDTDQSDDRITVGNLTEASVKLKKGLQILVDIDSNEQRVFSTKHGIKELLAYYEKILPEKKVCVLMTKR
ncbi:tigger transposable element-derived protein 1 [Trichonephila clavipes]|nr:tigger transposable element-derived protein 1 [Trichonephila clavipes]